jgi:tetratricopeptide (TPR) repeat protein
MLACVLCFFAFLAVGDASAQARRNLGSGFEVSASPAGNYLAALIAGADRDTLAASTFFREALRFDPRNRELRERAFIASLSNGNMRESFTLAERILRVDQKNGLAHLVLATRAIQAKQWASARESLNKSGGGRQRDITAILLNAWTYAGQGDAKRAVEMLDRIKDDRFTGFRDYHAGLIFDLVGNVPEAAKRLKSSYEGEKTSLRVVDAYGRFLARRGEREEAKNVYKAFDRLLPRHPIIRAALAALDANKPLEPLIRSAGAGAAEVFYGLGAVGGQQNDSLAAMIYLRMSLFLEADNGLAIVTLADIFERLKQYERALDVYELVSEKSPLHANAQIQSSLILEAMGRSDDALQQLKDLVVAEPREIEALTALGNLQRARKDYSESAKTYTRVIDLLATPARGDWTLFYFRGIAHERSKQWPLAEADFKKALELFPDQPLVLNYLGYSWVDQNMNLDEGLRLLRRAVSLRPDDGYIIDSLGWAHFRMGRYEEALRELERAIELKPGDPVINDHLGDAYWRMGRKLEAHFQWNHARDLKPEPEDMERILKKVESGLADEPKPASAEADGKKNGG